MARIEEYILIVSIAFSAVSLAYYLLNSWSSLKLKSSSNTDGRDTPEDVTIVVPVYNEDENTFRKCLRSLSTQGAKLLVIGDSSLEPFKSITLEHNGRFIHQEARKGKRGTISNSMNYVDTKYVLFVDSDTVIPKGAVASMLTKFNDKVGGVGTAVSVRVLEDDKVSYSSEFFEKLKEVMFRSMLMHNSVMVLDGRCAMYRTGLIKDFMLSDVYTNNKIFGKKSLLAEDRHLTSHIIRLGYKAAIDYDVTVITVPQKSFRLMFKQMVRWSRAGYFYFFKELADGTYPKRGLFYSFEMAYMYIFPIMLLILGLMRFDVALTHGLGNYLAYQLHHALFLLEFNFARLGHGFMISLWMQALVLFGLAMFGIAIASRIAKGRKLKTMAYGIVALLMVFVASMYGLFTVWKQNDWLTR